MTANTATGTENKMATKNRWYRAIEKATGRVVYLCKGFGSDGLGIAVYDFDRHPMAACNRVRPEQAKQQYTLMGVAPNTEEIERTFDWELNR
jgi:hypothetical protein